MGIVLLAAAVGLVVWLSRRGASAAVAAPASIGPVGWSVGTRWGAVRPLARADSYRLLRHPAFVVGVVATPLMLWAAAATGSETSWWQISPSLALALVPLGWATIIAANLLALQPRRTGADELLAAAPTPQPVRSVGLALSALPAAMVAAAVVGAWMVYLAGRSDDLPGSPRLLEVAAGLVIVAGSVTVGLAVARWLPHVGFGILAAVATAFIQARFFEISSWPWNRTEADPLRFLGFLAGPTSVDGPALELRPAGWHLVYLAGLVLVVVVVALARDGMPRLLGAALAAALVLTSAAGWAQVQPPSDQQVAVMVDYLHDPASHHVCTFDGPVRYCAFPEHEDRVDDWRQRVASVRSLLPASIAARPLAVTDRVPTISGDKNCAPQPFLDGVHPRVAEKVSVARVWPDDGAVHPGTDRFACGGGTANELFTAVQVGSWAVGLPPSPHGLDVRCSATGQARSALALWLGAAATPGGGASLRRIVDEPASASGVMTFSDWDDPPMWGVRFATADAELALRLLSMPAHQVAASVEHQWERLVAPATTTAELAEVAGVVGVAGPRAAPRSGAAGPTCS